MKEAMQIALAQQHSSELQQLGSWGSSRAGAPMTHKAKDERQIVIKGIRLTKDERGRKGQGQCDAFMVQRDDGTLQI